MSDADSPASTTDDAVESGASPLQQVFRLQHEATRNDPAPPYEVRIQRLEALGKALHAWEDRLTDAVNTDFGARSRHVTRIGEMMVIFEGLKYLRRNLKRWMRVERRKVGLPLQPASAEVRYQPKGVIGIISPWNYPLQLAFVPVATALAAGNRVMLKPSELTPLTSEAMHDLLAETYPDDVVATVLGGVQTGIAFSQLPFDHLLYTGSTSVGRKVMAAAAPNLTPVTLELGGKSPAIIHSSYPKDRAAERIVFGKLFNAGQTCIAPDYLLVGRGESQAMVEALRSEVAKQYPTMAHNPDYTAIVNERHHARLKAVLADAQAKGATLVEVNPAGESFDDADCHGRLPLTLVLDATDEMQVLQDEIFGPILPIVEVPDLDAAIRYVNDRPRPLALYYFDRSRSRIDKVLDYTVSGGACINDTLLHCAVEDIPFGGIGPSGLGAYHGKEGFETFSHKKGVFRQARINGTALLNPPFNSTTDRVLDFL